MEVENRYIEAGKAGVLLVNSACSGVPEGTGEWLKQNLSKHEKNIIFTHVPFDLQVIRSYILSVDPEKNMNKYVQSHAPGLFDEYVEKQVSHVFCGHVHFPGLVRSRLTEHHFIGMGITPYKHNKGITGRYYIVEIDDIIRYRVVQ